MATAKSDEHIVVDENVVRQPFPLRLEWLDPAELADNPANWRVHPDAQLRALEDIIARSGSQTPSCSTSGPAACWMATPERR